MKFLVTEIEFDFDDTAPMGYREDLACEVCTTIWDADDEDDLVEEITAATGWCIKSLDYRHALV